MNNEIEFNNVFLVLNYDWHFFPSCHTQSGTMMDRVLFEKCIFFVYEVPFSEADPSIQSVFRTEKKTWAATFLPCSIFL